MDEVFVFWGAGGLLWEVLGSEAGCFDDSSEGDALEDVLLLADEDEVVVVDSKVSVERAAMDVDGTDATKVLGIIGFD